MWVVAGEAIVLHRIMLHLPLGDRIIVAFEAKFPARFDEQGLVVRSMRAVAARALTAVHRIVLELHGLAEIVVTPETGFGHRFLEQSLVVRSVRGVAFEAFALHRRMFHLFLAACRIIVAAKA